MLAIQPPTIDNKIEFVTHQYASRRLNELLHGGQPRELFSRHRISRLASLHAHTHDTEHFNAIETDTTWNGCSPQAQALATIKGDAPPLVQVERALLTEHWRSGYPALRERKRDHQKWRGRWRGAVPTSDWVQKQAVRTRVFTICLSNDARVRCCNWRLFRIRRREFRYQKGHERVNDQAHGTIMRYKSLQGRYAVFVHISSWSLPIIPLPYEQAGSRAS